MLQFRLRAHRKKNVVDIPQAFYEEVRVAGQELRATTSGLVRYAVERYLGELRRKKLEEELAGYIANAALSKESIRSFCLWMQN